MWKLIIEYCHKTLKKKLKFKRAMIDFEISMIKTLREVFPFCRIHCCFFHLGQSIYRKVVELGLKKKYAKSARFSTEVKKLIALSFLKPNKIPDEFTKLQESGPKKLKGLYSWFSKYYVRGTKKSPYPRFDPEIWSHYYLNKKGLPRTDNSSESYHQTINGLMGSKHVGVGRLIKFLKDNAIATEQTLSRIRAGHSWPIPDKKERIDREKRLKKCTSTKL